MTISSNSLPQMKIPAADQKHIDTLQQVIINSEKRGTNPALQHAALGALYARYERSEEALNHFRKAIELDPDNPKIVLAYSRRGALYRVMGLFDQAQKDLYKAQTLSPSEAESQKINEEIQIVNKQLDPSFSLETSAIVPAMKSGFIPSTIGSGEVQAGGDLVNYFVSIVNFMEGEASQAPKVGTNEREKIYWNAFALCRTALEREQSHGMDEEARKRFDIAHEHLRVLINGYASEKRIPSVIWFMSAVVNFKRGFETESHENVNRAIEKNPNDEKYYRFRKLVRLQMGLTDLASQDDIYLRELNVIPEEIEELRTALIELNKQIFFYAEMTNDKNTYLGVVREFCERKMLTVSKRDLNDLNVEQMVEFFAVVGISLSPSPKSVHDAISPSVYVALAQLGVALEPKRGETLPPIEVLYLRRSMVYSLWAKKAEDSDKLLQAYEDIGVVVERTKDSQPELCARALLGRAKVSLHYKEYESTLGDLHRARSLAIDNPTLLAEIDRLIDFIFKGQK